ncbi:hypothetical protein PAMA_001336 [Pampus argenteus]
MTEPVETGAAESLTPKAVKHKTSLIAALNALEISQDVVVSMCATSEETNNRQTKQEDGLSICPPAADSPTTGSKSISVRQWVVGAQCQAVWSEDGQVYPATVMSLDGERCRVQFNDYGNEEDVELTALQPESAPQMQKYTKDWKAGSRCRVVYSEDGLVYPAVVLWVRGQRCCIRFDDYNNEEEHDLSSLLVPNELHGPSRATAAKSSTWRFSSSDWKRRRRRRRDENQGERGGERRPARSDDQQNASLSKVDKETEEKKKGYQQRDKADKLTSHSFSLFPPLPPPPQASSGDPVPFVPPLPLWMFGESGGSAGVDATTSMLMLWYMCGFHTGSYLAQQRFMSSSKD